MLALPELSERVVYAAAVALLGSPFPAATWAWHRWVKAGKKEQKSVAVLLVASASYLLLLSGIFVHEAIGPHYSTRRFATIYLNLTLMVLAVGWSALCAPPVRRPLVVTTTLLAAAWTYLAIVSSVV